MTKTSVYGEEKHRKKERHTLTHRERASSTHTAVALDRAHNQHTNAHTQRAQQFSSIQFSSVQRANIMNDPNVASDEQNREREREQR